MKKSCNYANIKNYYNIMMETSREDVINKKYGHMEEEVKEMTRVAEGVLSGKVGNVEGFKPTKQKQPIYINPATCGTGTRSQASCGNDAKKQRCERQCGGSCASTFCEKK